MAYAGKPLLNAAIESEETTARRMGAQTHEHAAAKLRDQAHPEINHAERIFDMGEEAANAHPDKLADEREVNAQAIEGRIDLSQAKLDRDQDELAGLGILSFRRRRKLEAEIAADQEALTKLKEQQKVDKNLNDQLARNELVKKEINGKSAPVPETFRDGDTRKFAINLAVGEKGFVRNRAVEVQGARRGISELVETYAASDPRSRDDPYVRATLERAPGSEPIFIFTCAPGESLDGQRSFEVTIY